MVSIQSSKNKNTYFDDCDLESVNNAKVLTENAHSGPVFKTADVI